MTPAPLWHETYNAQLLASFSGRLLADSLLFPLETILHRLILQGTRTIIDNTESGLDVVPVITKYSGALDCCRAVIVDEGLGGYYRGFGALVLQYALHGAILKVTELILRRVGQASDFDNIDVDTYRQHFDRHGGGGGDMRRLNQRPLNMHGSNVMRDPRLDRLTDSGHL